jgi:hypothetical protein
MNRVKAELRRTTRYAKYTYWQKRINDSSQSTKVFQMTKWHKTVGQFTSPPLIDPCSDDLATSPKEKQDLLARELLQKAATAQDVPIHLTNHNFQTNTLSLPTVT